MLNLAALSEEGHVELTCDGGKVNMTACGMTSFELHLGVPTQEEELDFGDFE